MNPPNAKLAAVTRTFMLFYNFSHSKLVGPRMYRRINESFNLSISNVIRQEITVRYNGETLVYYL